MALKWGRGFWLMVCLYGAVWAQGSELPRANLPSPVELLAPISKWLSGPMWTLSQGLNPRLAMALRGENEGEGLRKEFAAASTAFGRFGPSPVLQAPAAALVPFRDPAPAFSRGILVTRDLGDIPIQTEPHLAVDPKDPDHLVMGVIDYNMSSLVSYVSQDGGGSWEGPYQAPYLLDDLASAGDPVLAFDRQGNLYMTGISLGLEEFEVGPFSLTAVVSSMAVAKSDDGGFNWPATFSSARSRVETGKLTTDRQGRVRGEIQVGFLDKPWIATGPNPKNPTRDNIYVVYTDFESVYEVLYIDEVLSLARRETLTTIRLVKSEDGGTTWSAPIAISPTVREAAGEDSGRGEAVGKKRVVQGGNVAVAPDGSVYVAYFDSTDDESFKGIGEIYVARSTDGGATFSKPVQAAAFNELPFKARTSNFRLWSGGFPQMATGPKGEVYIVFAARSREKTADDGDVFFIRSTDGGRTFTRPRRLNADNTARTQFFPTIAVSPKGTLHAMWGDLRDDKSQTRYHIYYTRSEDRGDTWGFELKDQGVKNGDTRVTDFPSNPNRAFPGGQFIGDYFAIKATDEDVYMLWSDARLGEFGGFNQKIGFARGRTIKQPEIFVSPNAGPGGQNITLQGFNYQPDSTVFVLLGDAVVATARTNLEGRFSTALFMPITAEGAQNMRVVDASGNLATASYFTDFGFNNIQTLLKGLQTPSADPQVAALQDQINRNQAQIQQLQQQLAQVQQASQQVIQRLQQQLTQLQQTNQQLLQRLEQLQRSLPAPPKR